MTVAQAQRLRHAAATVRRQASGLTYHPMTGQQPRASHELLEALAAVDQVVKEIQQATNERAREEVALSVSGAAVVEQIRFCHAAADMDVQAVTAALEVLRTTLAAPNGAVLDAPYGRGAPARHHPGALCTMIAERVEHLATTLEITAIHKANLTRAAGSATGRSGA
jgi:hypothetical protein